MPFVLAQFAMKYAKMKFKTSSRCQQLIFIFLYLCVILCPLAEELNKSAAEI